MDLPRTFDAWEKRLVPFFLAIGPDGDASPIRAFEVTPRTLALACGVPCEFEKEVEEAFRLMLSRDLLLMDSLRLGSQRYEKVAVPNCFTYLAFTLLIDSLLEDGTSQSGEFRHKLVTWLGVDSTVSDLRGVALMWKSLVRWLDTRIQAGESFRRLILPDPGTWTHIGYTRRLSFPSKADLRLAVSFCRENPDAHRNPRNSIAAFPRLLSEASWGLNRAFEEFRGAYYLKRRALGDLPFWRLLEQASKLAGRPVGYSVTIDMLFDADGRAVFFGKREGEDDSKEFESLSDALMSCGADKSDLAVAAASGVLFFRLVGAGRWRVEPEANDSPFGLHVAVAERHKRRVCDRLGVLCYHKGWAFTPLPLSLEAVEDALRKAKLLADKVERIIRPYLVGGVRNNGVWLGRPHFLPALESDTKDYVICSALPHVTDVPLTLEQGQLKASWPIEGTFFIHPKLLRNEEHAPWRIRLQFSENAFVHKTLESVRYQLPLLLDWELGCSARLEIDAQDELEWEMGEPACADLLEAVYASGRGGWEEAELIALLGCADTVINPWLLLCALRDAGLVKPHLRSGWKGRVWTLNEPSIIEVHRGGQALAVVEGALCTRLVEDFRLAVEGLGGVTFRRLGVTPWAAPLIGAWNVRAKDLAKHLGWRFVAEPMVPSEKTLSLVETKHQALHYIPAATWSWCDCRFSANTSTQKQVQLIRLTHTGGRDHDVYKVELHGKTFHYLSRTAAIAAAHSFASEPLFDWRSEENLIALRVREGGLPDGLATETRRRMLRNGGPCGAEYFYPANKEVVNWLSEKLPGCISNPPKVLQDTPNLVSSSRRSFGRWRLKWHNGITSL